MLAPCRRKKRGSDMVAAQRATTNDADNSRELRFHQAFAKRCSRHPPWRVARLRGSGRRRMSITQGICRAEAHDEEDRAPLGRRQRDVVREDPHRSLPQPPRRREASSWGTTRAVEYGMRCTLPSPRSRRPRRAGASRRSGPVTGAAPPRLAPLLFALAPHRLAAQVLRLQPHLRRPAAIGRIGPLAHDALQSRADCSPLALLGVVLVTAPRELASGMSFTMARAGAR